MDHYTDRIRRLAPGKSLQTIGVGSGLGVNSIYRWDKESTPSLVALAKIANYLNVDYRLLMPDQDEVLRRSEHLNRYRGKQVAAHD